MMKVDDENLEREIVRLTCLPDELYNVARDTVVPKEIQQFMNIPSQTMDIYKSIEVGASMVMINPEFSLLYKPTGRKFGHYEILRKDYTMLRSRK